MIKLTNISKYYKGNDTVALGLHRINLEFDAGDFVVITGESGGGKSTLLNVISGSLAYDDGELYFEGEETSWYGEAEWENYRKEKIGFVYQDYRLIDSFSAVDNVKTAILLRQPDIKEREARDKALSYLKKTGLEKQAGKKAAQLSSGQKQRLSIARALAKETKVIVADEPTGNLDVENSQQIIEILSSLSKDRLVIMVTHNYDEAEPFATRKIRLYDGEVAEDIRLKPRHETKETTDLEEVLNTVPLQNQRKERKRQDRLLAKKMIQKIRRAKPCSTLLLFILFLLLYTSIFIFYGTFEKNLDYYPSRLYSHNTFVNNDMTRICVKKPDGSAMAKQDIEKLRSLKYVKYLDLYDLANDVYYMTEEGKDYNVNQAYQVSVVDESKTVRSVSGMTKEQITGSMAEGYYEVVVSSKDKSLIGQSITLAFNRKNTWNQSYIKNEFKVTGITDIGEEGQIYVSELFAQMLNVITHRLTDYVLYGIYAEEGYGLYTEEWLAKTKADEQSVTIEEWMLLSENHMELREIAGDDLGKVGMEKLENPIFVVNEQLSGKEAHVSVKFYDNAYITDTLQQPPVNIKQMLYPTAYLFSGAPDDRKGIELQLQEPAVEYSLPVIEVSREVFDSIYPDKSSYQISLYIEDYAYTDRAIKLIEEAGYEAASVFRAGSADYDIDKANEQTFVLFTSLAALATVFFVGIFLIRATINSRKKDYSILLLIGVSRQIIDWMNLRDILWNSAAALIGTVAAVNLAMYYEVPYLKSAVRYYEILDYLIYAAITFMMSVMLYGRLKASGKKLKIDM